MRKLHFLLGLCFCLGVATLRGDTLTLADGSSLSGEILRADGEGLMLRLQDSSYTNLSWPQFSQDSLKQLAQNPKFARFAEPFIEPSEPERAPQPEITVKPVTRLIRPAHPSIILGVLQSPVGWFILLVLYAANLVAAYEIALFKLRKPLEVVGWSALLPVIGPVIFLARAEQLAPAVEEAPADAVMAPAGTQENPQAEIPIVEFTHKAEEKKPEPQVFARGKFTFNKRFIETKFAGFIGQPKGEALTFSMELKSAKEAFAVERILQVTPTEVVVETVQRQEFKVLLGDIQEIKLIPKIA